MNLNNKIAYYQRLGNKTEFKDIIKKSVLIRVDSQNNLESFIKSIEKYEKSNDIIIPKNILLSETFFPFQFRINFSEEKNIFYLLIYKSISERLYEKLLIEEKAINSLNIHYEKDFYV